MVEIDVLAVVDLCSRFLPGMVRRGRGAVLNVASTGAFQPLPGQAGYGAGKAFVLSYTQSLGGELRGTGVTATTLCPGPVDTGFGERAGFTKEDAAAALPAVMWETPEAVARAGIDGLAAGRAVVIPGLANRAAAALGRLLPNRALVPLLARSHPGLAPDRSAVGGTTAGTGRRPGPPRRSGHGPAPAAPSTRRPTGTRPSSRRRLVVMAASENGCAGHVWRPWPNAVTSSTAARAEGSASRRPLHRAGSHSAMPGADDRLVRGRRVATVTPGGTRWTASPTSRAIGART